MTDPTETETEDAQRRAFTEAGPADWAAETALLAGALVYEPGDPTPIKTPEEWDAEDWDAGRQNPKTLDEARAALAARIADPHAPDTEAESGAYDELEG
ncbi:hypothetical protein [Amycolatopsis sp. NPDC051128]|uniref:hypothetical protein n=1 Tax=Amycolatopsis sp. NPDC051128 TaxID=3155412 RepID=UPI00341252C1